MATHSITSILLKCFTFLRILPSEKRTWLNKIGTILWFLIGLVGCAGLLVYDYKTLNFADFDSYTFSFVASDLISMISTTLPFPAMSYFATKLYHPLLEPNLTRPLRVWHLLATVITFFLSMGSLAWEFIPVYTSFYRVFIVMADINLLISGISEVFIFGVVSSWFSSKVDRLLQQSDLDLQVECGEIIDLFSQMKKGAAPLLFIVFATDTCFFIFIAYMVSQQPIIGIFIPYEVLKLSYIAFVVEDCYTKFQSVVPRCRYKLYIFKQKLKLEN